MEAGNNVFCDDREELTEETDSFLSAIGLSDIITSRDLYKCYNIAHKGHINHIYEYLDDVFIDTFFRTNQFHRIIFPKGLCHIRITPEGIIHHEGEVVLNLNQLYDRCTFAICIWRLFGIDNDLFNVFPKNDFIKHFYIELKTFGGHAYCGILNNQFPFHIYCDEYYSLSSDRKNLLHSNCCRGQELVSFGKFIRTHYDCPMPFDLRFHDFNRGYSQIRNSHIFGEYSIEEILCIYSLLTDKFIIDDNSFILCISQYLEDISENRIIKDFIEFERKTYNTSQIEPYIVANDLYLRFASHNTSKAFKFERENDAVQSITLFQQRPIKFPAYGNTLPLPYLYNEINK